MDRVEFDTAGRDRRRRAVLAGYDAEAEPAALVDDPDPHVRAAALGALSRRGRLDARLLDTALHDEDEQVRRRAATLAGAYLAAGAAAGATKGDPLRAGTRAATSPDGDERSVVASLARALHDEAPLVAEAAAWALGEAGEAALRTVDDLCAVARAHPDLLVRESAVAALGAIGAPRALDAVLDALEGPPALRRRAAVALAAFDDPRADDGLRRCLSDRDWQVRQVAEVLLDLPPGEVPPPVRRPARGR